MCLWIKSALVLKDKNHYSINKHNRYRPVDTEDRWKVVRGDRGGGAAQKDGGQTGSYEAGDTKHSVGDTGSSVVTATRGARWVLEVPGGERFVKRMTVSP